MINVYLLDKTLKRTALLSTYMSLAWSCRFQEIASFELKCVPDDLELFPVQLGSFLVLDVAPNIQVVDSIEFTRSADGEFVLIQGHSLESILDRRILVGDITVTGSIDTITSQIFKDTIISPKDSKRKIANFEYIKPTDKVILNYRGDSTYSNVPVLDVVAGMVTQSTIGFKMTISGSKIQFQYYVGLDRSVSQAHAAETSKSGALIWLSPYMGNLDSHRFYQATDQSKNVVYVTGSTTGPDNETIDKLILVGDASGLDRKEMTTQYTSESQEDLTVAELEKRMTLTGKIELLNARPITAMEADVDSIDDLVFMKDYNLGDIITIQDSYNHRMDALITEVMITCDSNGVDYAPTFMPI